jgi:hypothetical protein
MTADTVPAPARDFDFFHGEWTVRHRRLKGPLAGSTEWEEFEGRSTCWPLWDGDANVDQVDGDPSAGPLHGLTLRLFDPVAGVWRLYWANRRRGILDEPMIGRFSDGRGEFFNAELFDGRPILVRYTWSDIAATSCRWEQALHRRTIRRGLP